MERKGPYYGPKGLSLCADPQTILHADHHLTNHFINWVKSRGEPTEDHTCKMEHKHNFKITWYNSDTHNARTLISANIPKQTLHMRASSKTEASNPWDWRSHHRSFAFDGNVAYYWNFNAIKFYNIRSHRKHNILNRMFAKCSEFWKNLLFLLLG